MEGIVTRSQTALATSAAHFSTFVGTSPFCPSNRVLAKEIALLRREVLTDAEGRLTDATSLTDNALKQIGGSSIPLNKDLQAALALLKAEAGKSKRPSSFVITSELGEKTSSYAVVNMIAGWYRILGFTGASSHSGQRTFLTNAARRISTVSGSLRDVQLLASHSALGTTQRYIEADGVAQRRVVEVRS